MLMYKSQYNQGFRQNFNKSTIIIELFNCIEQIQYLLQYNFCTFDLQINSYEVVTEKQEHKFR